ncbi:MAG: Ldh family oxidoreductase, partial [Acidimicrobiales bacterium]|nr:Ldh family oxidoreductase [Acidimicrobiales bacterium]
RFLPLDVFRQRVDELIRDVRRAERADGVDRIYVPGEIEHGRRADRAANGIPLSAALVTELSRIGVELGVGALVDA